MFAKELYVPLQILLLHLHARPRRNMYCLVYSCNGDSQKNPSGIRFFSFPSGKSVAQQQRRKVWVEFCKRKKFNPSCSRICSRHFTEDAYEKGHSPQFLEQIECKEAFRVRLRSDALPTLPLVEASSSKLRTSTARRQQEKVSRVLD